MKKLICLVLALLTVLSLSSCFLLAKEVPEETTGAALRQPYEGGSKVEEFDESGNPILTSADNRLVYPYKNDGYVVFVFIGDMLTKIQRIYVFEDADSAQEYVNEQSIAAVEAGKIPPIYVLRGNFAILDIKADNDPDNLCSYYTKSKAEIVSAFEPNKEIVE